MWIKNVQTYAMQIHGEKKKTHQKAQTIGQAWWCAPVVPDTWEAGAGESLEPRSLRLQ